LTFRRLLAIETSSPRLSLAAGTNAGVLRSYQGPLEWRHAETLFQGLEKILKAARWRPDSLNGVAVSIGPGSFTGIRIGLAAARALGQSLKIPVVGVNALEAIAFGAPAHSVWISPVIDALRGSVFSALHERRNGALRTRVKERCMTWKEWAALVPPITDSSSTLWLAGSGLSTMPAFAAAPAKRLQALPEAYHVPRAKTLLALAQPRWKTAGSYDDVFPLYLRKTAAEERRGRR